LSVFVKTTIKSGCGSFFCTDLFWTRRVGRRASEKRLAPGIARARMTSEVLRARSSLRRGASADRWVRQPIQTCSPEDQSPKGAGQPKLAACLPPTRAKRSSMGHRCRPRLGPLPIADRIAEHQYGIDVLPTPAHASPFEARFDDAQVSTFDAPRANRPACCVIGRVLHLRFTLLQIGQFLLDS
jgi:hypothetical protein